MTETGVTSIWDEYAEYEEAFVEKGGGGKKKQRNPGGKTSKAARDASVERSEEIAKDKAQKRIVDVLGGFPKFKHADGEDRFIEKYVDWIRKQLNNAGNLPILLTDDEFKFKFVRSRIHSGGQNVNKVNSSAICTHVITNIRTRSDGRDQIQNRQDAREKLQNLLIQHIDDWRVYLGNSGQELLTPGLIINLKLSTI